MMDMTQFNTIQFTYHVRRLAGLAPYVFRPDRERRGVIVRFETVRLLFGQEYFSSYS